MIINLNFKNKIFLILLLFSISNLFGQTNESYELLNQIKLNLFNFVEGDTINLYENQIEFPNQKEFFTKEFLTNYTFPTLGVDSMKVRKMIIKLNLTYLSRQYQQIEKWEAGKINYSVRFSVPQNDVRKLYKVSYPIFTENRKFAFIYYEKLIVNGDYIDSGSGTVKVYQKKHGRWRFYVQIPIFIS